ncbi:YihY/virulence factor BrkB family protein [Luteolibacter sp. Populi]|uniref:YihY/virulence factor BrkB family protein n=1 Tax=Luteolibacter sp. Populi TaxID=3230487 RepID=UPI0034675B46
MDAKLAWNVLKQTLREFHEDDAFTLSASLAYYAAFSLAPLLLISIAVAGTVFGEDAVRGQLDDEMRASLGASGALAVQDMVAHAYKTDGNIWASIAGIAMLLIGAGGFYGQLQMALDRVWGVKPKSGSGILAELKSRFVSFTMVLGTGFLLLTSMILSAVLAALGKYADTILQLPAALWNTINGIASFAVIALLFAAIFKVLPDVRVKWHHVRFAAIFTALLFTLGKMLIGWYLGREATNSSYGTAGSLALVLIWLYYSSIILLFGAEFTQVWAERHGEKIQPTEDAEFPGEPG